MDGNQRKLKRFVDQEAIFQMPRNIRQSIHYKMSAHVNQAVSQWFHNRIKLLRSQSASTKPVVELVGEGTAAMIGMRRRDVVLLDKLRQQLR